jgi:hypothetical protein
VSSLYAPIQNKPLVKASVDARGLQGLMGVCFSAVAMITALMVVVSWLGRTVTTAVV